MTGRTNFGWMIVAMCLSLPAPGQAKKTPSLVIHFQNQVGKRLLNFDSVYTNPYGESFTIRNFRYYVSHFSVIGVNGKKHLLPVSYFLIDERKPESKIVTLPVSLPAIKAIRFEIGVDSSKSVSGVQTGALDPANGMFWTWNSGYIFAKLEGTSPQAKAPQNNFTYHIGGFRNGEEAVREVELRLPADFSPVKDSLVIAADINAWFDGLHPLKIADLPSIMTPGPKAIQVADNYSLMFSIATRP